MKPTEAVERLRERANIMQAMSMSLRTKSSDAVPEDKMALMIDELLRFASDLAERCSQSQRITARIIEVFSTIAEFEVFSIEDMAIPSQETVIDDMTEALKEPPFEADFFHSTDHYFNDESDPGPRD